MTYKHINKHSTKIFDFSEGKIRNHLCKNSIFSKNKSKLNIMCNPIVQRIIYMYSFIIEIKFDNSNESDISI